MAFKLLLAAEKRWQGVNAPHLVALATAGEKFPNGQAEMFQFQPETSEDCLFIPTPLICATTEASIHSIWQHLPPTVPEMEVTKHLEKRYHDSQKEDRCQLPVS